jgi:hypothetical protein
VACCARLIPLTPLTHHLTPLTPLTPLTHHLPPPYALQLARAGAHLYPLQGGAGKLDEQTAVVRPQCASSRNLQCASSSVFLCPALHPLPRYSSSIPPLFLLSSSSIPPLFLLYSSSIPPLSLLYSSSIPPLFLLYSSLTGTKTRCLPPSCPPSSSTSPPRKPPRYG